MAKRKKPKLPKVRSPVPPPSFPMGKSGYDRKGEKERLKKEVEEYEQEKKEEASDIVAMAREIEEEVIKQRRDFHAHPEPCFQEVRTSSIIAQELKSLGIEVKKGLARTGVIGYLKVSQAQGTIAFRADMDALKMDEDNDLPFHSRTPGVAHTCGHDAHMAMLLGAAKVLSRLKADLPCNVKFIFQPCEESPPGGAEALTCAGVLKDVDEIYGLHVFSALESGIFGIKEGPAMAAVDKFEIEIKGKGGHGAMPHLSIDPVPLAAEAVLALQTIPGRRRDPTDAVVLSVCQIQGGTAFNIIPETVSLSGTVRTLSEKTRGQMPGMMEEILRGIAEPRGATYKLDYQPGYSALHNDPECVEKVRRSVRVLFGKEALREMPVIMVSEDFAYYLKHTKGAFVFLGVGNEKIGANAPHHSPHFVIDEGALYRGIALLAHLAYAQSKVMS